ncbi:MAG: glycosyltransferase family 2 protein [Pseudomonadota bacterium]
MPPTEPLDLVVSIINYRTGDMTIRCVASVLADMGKIRGHVVVVDNASGDGSADQIAEWIAARDSPVSLVRSPGNTGFSGGHNQGMNFARAGHYLILNSDAELRPGCLAAFMEAAEKHPDHGLIAPRLEDPDGTPQISTFRFPTPFSELIRGARTGIVTRLLRRWNVSLGTAPSPDAIEWVSFACVLLNARMLDRIGMMDEGYFLYFEDTDTCWRARSAGWRILPCPQARVVHFRGGSAPVKALVAARKRLPGYYYAARTRVLFRLHGRLGLTAANLAWHLGRSIAAMRGLLGKPVPAANQNEARDIWINYRDPLGDRRAPDEG